MAMLLFWGRRVAAADKIDVLQLRIGDRLTCEIKKLERGVLSVSTDPLGTVSVHWGEVADVASPRQFEIQVTSGEHFYGSLVASPTGEMIVKFAAGDTMTLPLADVIVLVPIGASLWSRVDGGLDAGFSFTQAQVETHLTLNGNATYRSPKYEEARPRRGAERMAARVSERLLLELQRIRELLTAIHRMNRKTTTSGSASR